MLKLTHSFVDWIVIIERNVGKSTSAFGVAILDQVYVIHFAELRKIFRQQGVIRTLFQPADKDFPHSKLVLPV